MMVGTGYIILRESSRVDILTARKPPGHHIGRSESTQANMAARYGERNGRAGVYSPTQPRTVKPYSQLDEQSGTTRTIKFHPMTYDRRQSEARRVSVSNIGLLN